MERSPRTDVRFRELYDDNFPAVRNYCIRRLPASEVNDAVAEVFMVAWRRIEEAPHGDEARLWLFGVARNVVRNADRSSRRWMRLNLRLRGVAPEPNPSPETLVVRRSGDERVLAALGSLSESDQEVLRLSAWEELSTAEIAVLLGVDPHAVTMRLSRARNRLARRLHLDTTPTGSRVGFLPVNEGGDR